MIVYHGSTEIIKNPDVVHSKKYLDFGRGFYITTFENQAKKWAVRKGMRQEKNAIVNVYELSEAWDDFKVLSFEKASEKEETFPVKFLINIRKSYTGPDTIFQPVRSVRIAAWRSRRGYRYSSAASRA